MKSIRSVPKHEYLKVVPRIAYYYLKTKNIRGISNINVDYSQQQVWKVRMGRYIYFLTL